MSRLEKRRVTTQILDQLSVNERIESRIQIMAQPACVAGLRPRRFEESSVTMLSDEAVTAPMELIRMNH